MKIKNIKGAVDVVNEINENSAIGKVINDITENSAVSKAAKDFQKIKESLDSPVDFGKLGLDEVDLSRIVIWGMTQRCTQDELKTELLKHKNNYVLVAEQSTTITEELKIKYKDLANDIDLYLDGKITKI